MTRTQIYNYALSKGCSRDKAIELSINNEGKDSSDISELGDLVVAVPLAGAVIADDLLGNVPSAICGELFDSFF